MLNTVLIQFNNYKRILFLAIAVGIIHVSFILIIKFILIPDNFFLLSFNNKTPGVVLDLTQPYLPQINDVLEGEFFNYESTTIEHKFRLNPNIQKGSIYFLSIFYLIFGKNSELATIFIYILFPAVSFFLMYLFISRSISYKSTFIPIVFSLAVLIFTNNYEWKILFNDFNIFHNIKSAFLHFFGLFQPMEKSLNFIRVTTPLPNFIWLILYLVYLTFYLDRPTVKKSLLCGLLIGTAFYTYIYLVSLMGILTCIAFALFIKRNGADHGRLFLLTLLTAFICGIPYLYIFYQYLLTDYGSEYITVIGQKAERFDISWLPSIMLIVISTTFFYIRKLKSSTNIVIFASLLACLISINLQIVFGTNTHIWHWVDFFAMPLLIISIGILFYELSIRNQIMIKIKKLKIYNQVSVVFVAVLLASMLGKQVGFALYSSEGFYLDNDYRDALQWMSENLEKDTSIGTLNGEFIGMIPAHTSARLLFPVWSYTQVTLEEYNERLAYTILLMNTGIENAKIFLHKYDFTLKKTLFPAVNENRDNFFDTFLKNFEAGFYDLQDLKSKYICHYILIDDTFLEIAENYTPPDHLNLIFENNKIKIFIINNDILD